MLLGQFESKVGEKFRVAFPKRFRQILGEKIIVTYGFESSLIIVSQSNWMSLLEGTADKPFLLSGARDTQRFLLGGAMLCELDNQGRFIIPDYLRSFAKIEAEVVFVGLYKYVEAWDKKNWVDYQNKTKKNISQIAEKLIEKIEKT